MRHQFFTRLLTPPLPILSLPVAMTFASALAALVLLACAPPRLPTRLLGALLAAVPIPSVARPTEREDSTASRASVLDQAFHRGRTARKLDSPIPAWDTAITLVLPAASVGLGRAGVSLPVRPLSFPDPTTPLR
jgi:hypothetical protein